jgi:hypothetical protein
MPSAHMTKLLDHMRFPSRCGLASQLVAAAAAAAAAAADER